jgi:acyl-CoA synthetase (AMP-forming)/AMP-acid ligase II
LNRPSINIPLEPLTSPLRRAAEKFPDKPAVICPEAGGRETSYGWLDEVSSVMAASLAGLGISPGERVALWLKNSLEYILSFYAILKAGGVIVPVSTHYGEKEILHPLRETGTVGLITSDSLCLHAGGLLATLKGRLRFLVLQEPEASVEWALPLPRLLEGSERLDRSDEIEPKEDLAVLLFSSGTTGLPKGVMLTHSNLLSNLYQLIPAHEISDRDVLLNQLPFFHIYGMTVLMGTSIMAGATQVLASRFRPIDEFLSLFETYRPSLSFTVPLVLQEFCHHPRVQTMDWSRLRYINTGGAPLSPELQERFTQITGVPGSPSGKILRRVLKNASC